MAATIDASSGLLWQDGCAGPKVTRGFFNLNDVDAGHPELAAGRRGMGRPSGQRPGRGRRRQGHADVLLLYELLRSIRTYVGRPVHAAGALSDLRRATARLRSVRRAA